MSRQNKKDLRICTELGVCVASMSLITLSQALFNTPYHYILIAFSITSMLMFVWEMIRYSVNIDRKIEGIRKQYCNYMINQKSHGGI